MKASAPGWQMTSYIIEGVVVALLAAAEILLVRGYLKKKRPVILARPSSFHALVPSLPG